MNLKPLQRNIDERLKVKKTKRGRRKTCSDSNQDKLLSVLLILILKIKITKQSQEDRITKRTVPGMKFTQITNTEISNNPDIFSIATTASDNLFSITKDIDDLRPFRLYNPDGSQYKGRVKNAVFVSKENLLVLHSVNSSLRYQLFQ